MPAILVNDVRAEWNSTIQAFESEKMLVRGLLGSEFIFMFGVGWVAWGVVHISISAIYLFLFCYLSIFILLSIYFYSAIYPLGHTLHAGHCELFISF